MTIYVCECGAQILNPSAKPPFCQECKGPLEWGQMCINCDEQATHGCLCKWCLRAALVPSIILAIVGWVLSKL